MAVHGDENPHDYVDDDGNLFLEGEEIQTVGAPLNLTWTVRKCIGCRRRQWQEGGPEEIMDRLPRTLIHIVKTIPEWCHIYPGYRSLVGDRMHSPFPTTEESVLSELEQHYGGAAGVKAAGKTSKDYYMKTKARIQWYRQQD